VLERHSGSAEQLHHLEVPERRTVMVLEVDRPALVLGSTQSPSLVATDRLAASGIELARRRSGGGVVLLVPGEHVWVDVVLPADDPLWVPDVDRSSWWLGEAWAAAIAAVAPIGSEVEVHRGPVSDRELGAQVCFAALGPGEVSVGGRKLVGVSQRRTRRTARFQCVLFRHIEPDATLSLLAPPVDAHDAAARERLRVALDAVADLPAVGVDPGWSVVEDLLAHLP
jgi:lipoate-protein ligase A